MHVRSLIGLALLLAALVAIGAAGAQQTFADPAGDAGAAPDITGVTVSDTSEGLVTWVVTTNAAALTADTVLSVTFETDGNSATGDTAGFDYYVGIDGSSFVFGKLEGSSLDAAVPGTTVAASFSAGTFTFKVHKSEIGNPPTTVRFYADALLYSGNIVTASDTAPDGGAVWEYRLTPPRPRPPLVLTAGTPVAAPARPAAGKRVTVSVPVTRTDTGAAVTSGTVSCLASVGNRPVPAAGRFTGGLARCTLKVPAKTKGKKLRGAVTVVFQGRQVRKPFAFTVS